MKLNEAIQERKTKEAINLIKQGANIEDLGIYGETPLHWAALHGYTEIVQRLLDRDANINTIDNNELTPLHFAVYRNNLKIVSLLVEKGADIEFHTNNTLSPLQFAISKNKFQCTFCLIKGTEARFDELTIPNNRLGAYLTEQYLIATSETNEKSESIENDENSLIRVSMINCAKAIFGMETTDKAESLLKIKIGALKSRVKDPYINTLKFLYYFIRFGLSAENINHIIGFVRLYDAKVDLNDIMSDLSPRSSKAILNQVVLKQTNTAIKTSSITDCCTIS